MPTQEECVKLGDLDYLEFLRSIEGTLSSFPGSPWVLAPDHFVLRHDIDDNLDRAVQMAEIEAAHGFHSTFFMLDTMPYFESGFDKMRHIQSLGHEVGWHNNAIAAAVLSVGKDAAREGAPLDEALRDAIERPLRAMRDHGLVVRGTASHGDSLCGELDFVNYQAWDCYPKKNALNHRQHRLADFGLDYEAYYCKGRRLSDSGGQFNTDPAAMIAQWNDAHEWPIYILVHCQWWS